jgi:hypothetical protein
MEIVNLILIIVGVIAILIGVGAVLNPNIARFINAPGAGPRLKAFIALITGLILILIGFLVNIPTR